MLPTGGEKIASINWNPFNRISNKDKTFIARQLAIMLESGLPVAQAVRYLSDQSRNPHAKEILTEVLRDIENGYRLSDATKKHPEMFSQIFVAVVTAGESSGKLSEVLNMLAGEEEREVGFRGKVIGSLLYPAFIVGAMIVVGIIMVTRVVPPLESVFKESGQALPWTTLTVIAITNSLMNFWYLYIIGVVAIVFFGGRYLATVDGRKALSGLELKIPAVNTLISNLEMARFTHIFSMLIAAGVPIIQAINSVAAVLDNVLYKEALLQVAHNVERGAPISQSMARQGIFPVVIYQMMGVGEQTGKLEEVLKKLSEYYEEELNQSIKNITALTEPVVFVFVGLGVAFLVFSIIVPIYNLAGAIQ